MLAAVIERPGTVPVREVPAPRAAGLALVRVGVAGICGTGRKLAAGVFPPDAARALAASEDPAQLKVVLDVAAT
jgi:threonine dehydrogenase-like Zn-dependent dehydrogenase